MPLVLLLLACGGHAGKTDTNGAAGDSAADTDTPADTDTGPACATVTSGTDWAWQGECPQMTTPVAITVDGCTMTLDYASGGGMTMGMPYSGTIDGTTVTFADDDTVTGCVGTVDTADKITGTCAGGCTFRLRR